MKPQIVSIAIIACSCLAAKADTVTWTYFTGWDHGFVLTVDSKTSSISVRDRKTDTKRTESIHNSEDMVGYFAALIRRIKSDPVGFYADDGPENKVEFSNDEGVLNRTIYDISPPRYFVQCKIQDPAYSAEGALMEADGFLKEVDAFLLLDQLQELKRSYFEESSSFGNPGGGSKSQSTAERPAAADEAK